QRSQPCLSRDLSMSQGVRLNSWKEIAAYLGRDVRTVLRWEKQRGLPIRSIPGGKRRRVFAYPFEIEAWLDGRPSGREYY
ncbi:MAG: DNA-binding protein, partial [Terriglobia bacterium]